MLMDAERIERDVQVLEDIQRAELNAYGWHEPKELRRLRDRVRGALLMKRATITDADLIAYALEQQRRKKAEAVS
jgi:hypothetical protein